jgi:uracil-DNA glycosylase
MPQALSDAMAEILAGWQDDLPTAWRPVLGGTALGFAGIDPALMLEPWEPVFPVRRGRIFPGAPKGAHMFRAFDGIAPERVRCVVLGQDPYPDPNFSTGRAFEAGNVARWIELEKMFSVSVRTFMQQIVAARTGDPTYAATTAGWRRILAELDAGTLDLEPAGAIADRWVASGALLLNSALTLSRFRVEGDPHQLRGHLPLWRPLMVAVLRHLAGRGTPVVFIGFGGQAADALAAAGIAEGDDPGRRLACMLRDHPARGDAVLALPNPFAAVNRSLAAMGTDPISW